MPVTIRPHPDKEPGTWRHKVTTKLGDILDKAGWESDDIKSNGLSQSSFDNSEIPITAALHGLVDAAIEAWNSHHHLVLRPDDFWLAIICQLGFFINEHAEDLRDLFVEHDGKKELQVDQEANFQSADYAEFTKGMASKIGENVKDPEMVPWALPNFSTTTDTDRVAGAVLLMGAMQQYFDYAYNCCSCGIPSVTLLGEKADWELLAGKVEVITRFFVTENDIKKDCVAEVEDFVKLLKPLMRHMILSFDEPDSKAVTKFWGMIACKEDPGGMSGGPDVYVTGWITTFNFWTSKGVKNLTKYPQFVEENSYFIDGVQYVPMDENDAVVGYASVPVKVRELDAGGNVTAVKNCRMVAGLLASRPARLDQLDESEEESAAARSRRYPQSRRRFLPHDTTRYPGSPSADLGYSAVQPYVGWAIFEEEDD
ncbi:DUF4419 domain protein [Podospora fimiseda]|uniref:DUF4419 domain protein n=1 Tax=Podospora fimiseda TaxID=252190 RepID=A0AAN7BIM1_9PEZI|nr:DUF4419 domain protein [Podospora fimiseda]